MTSILDDIAIPPCAVESSVASTQQEGASKQQDGASTQQDACRAALHARVGVIGLGYVGLPLARAMAEAGFTATGFDTDPEKVRLPGAGRSSYMRHIPDEAIAALLASGRFTATASFAQVGTLDAIAICGPGRQGDPQARTGHGGDGRRQPRPRALPGA